MRSEIPTRLPADSNGQNEALGYFRDPVFFGDFGESDLRAHSLLETVHRKVFNETAKAIYHEIYELRYLLPRYLWFGHGNTGTCSRIDCARKGPASVFDIVAALN